MIEQELQKINHQLREIRERMPEYETVKEHAHRLKVSEMTIYRAIKNGELPAVKIGKQIRIKIG